MASAFAHALTAYSLNKIACPALNNKRFLFFVIISSILPDLDVLGFRFGIAYGDLWGHRGLTHSLFFAVIWALLLWALLRSSVDYKQTPFLSKTGFIAIIILFLSTASHGLLDAMTNGGLGVAFFSPFDNTRYFLPWQPIQVSPIGIRDFFSVYGLRVILSELIWIGLPCLFFLTIITIKNRVNKR